MTDMMFGPMRPLARELRSYVPLAGEEAVEEIRRLAEPLRGARLLHLSFSPYGTAMADLVGALVPLLRSAGVDAEWQVAACPEPYKRAAHEVYRGLTGRGRVRWRH